MSKLSRFKNIVTSSKKHLETSKKEIVINEDDKKNILNDFKNNRFLVGSFELEILDVTNAFRIIIKETPCVAIDLLATKEIQKIADKYETNDYELVYIICNIDKTHSAVEFQAI